MPPTAPMASSLPALIDDDTELEDEELPPMEMLEDAPEPVIIPIPAGFAIPDQARNGEPFEAKVMLRLDGDGLLIDSLEAGAPALAKAAVKGAEKAVEKVATDEENDEEMLRELTNLR